MTIPSLPPETLPESIYHCTPIVEVMLVLMGVGTEIHAGRDPREGPPFLQPQAAVNGNFLVGHLCGHQRELHVRCSGNSPDSAPGPKTWGREGSSRPVSALQLRVFLAMAPGNNFLLGSPQFSYLVWKMQQAVNQRGGGIGREK